MKKYISIIIISFLLILFVHYLLFFIKKEHLVNYKIDNYKIEESYNYNKGIHDYSFVIEDNNKYIYNFNYVNNIKKKSNIINKIKEYKEKDLICIIPMYIDDNNGNIYCNRNNITYSYSYLLRNKDEDFLKIIKKIKKDGYYSNKLDINNKKTSKGKVKYYLKNIPSNYKFIMWNYTGIDIIDRLNVSKKKFISKNDMYENPYSTMVNEYYMFLDSTNRNYIKSYNINKKKDIKIKNKKENFTGSYIILGTFNNNLYMIDTDKYIEYKINPYKKKVEKIGEEKKGYITIRDRKEMKVETSLLKNNPDKYKFVSKVKDKKISDKYNTKNIYYYNGFYYFKSKDNIFYRSSSKYKNKATTLFKLDKVNYWYIYDDNILVIDDEYLYFYNDNYGFKKIINNIEFKYNYNNICLVYNEIE